MIRSSAAGLLGGLFLLVVLWTPLPAQDQTKKALDDFNEHLRKLTADDKKRVEAQIKEARKQMAELQNVLQLAEGWKLLGENDYRQGTKKIEDWVKAYELLHKLPPQDRGKDLLTGFILQYNHTPPPNWEGVIPLLNK